MIDDKTINAIFQRWQNENPHPKSDLHYVNDYTLLVAVVLSAQTTDQGVNKATRTLFDEISNPADMLALGEDALREAIKTIGLFRNKAKNVIALSQMLLDKHQGNVPQNREDLEALPGVGRKTANVVLNAAFGAPLIAVDTHVLRLANRLGLANSTKAIEVETALEKRVPKAFLAHAHHWLVLHGRYVCKARKPLCESCLIADLCTAPENSTRHH